MTTYKEYLDSDPPASSEEAWNYEYRVKRRLVLEDGDVRDKPDEQLLNLIRAWMDEAKAGDKFTIVIVEMTDAEVHRFTLRTP